MRLSNICKKIIQFEKEIELKQYIILGTTDNESIEYLENELNKLVNEYEKVKEVIRKYNVG